MPRIVGASSFVTSSATEGMICGDERQCCVGGRAGGGREFVTGIWPPEFERILNGESASMLAQDARLGKL